MCLTMSTLCIQFIKQSYLTFPTESHWSGHNLNGIFLEVRDGPLESYGGGGGEGNFRAAGIFFR